MAKFCTACGREIRPGDSFCLGCGKPVARNAQSSGGAGAQASAPSENYVAAPLSAFAAFEQDTESDMAETEVWRVSPEGTTILAATAPGPVETPRDNQFDGNLPPAALEPRTLNGKPPASAGSSHPPSASLFDEREVGQNEEKEVNASLGPFDDDDGDDPDESLTIVAQPIIEDDDEDESPTIVVPRERHVLVRDSDGQRIELSLPCILGRGKAADKRVKGNLAVSRKHAKMFQEDELILVQDLESTNGTFVNGVELEGDQCEPISDGAAIRLGTEDFTFHVESV